MSKLKLTGTVTNKSDFIIRLPDEDADNGDIIYVQEGSGMSLTKEDRDNGLVDYIDYTRISSVSGDERDGGQVMTKTYYEDMSLEEIIEEVFDIEDIHYDQTVIVEDNDE